MQRCLISFIYNAVAPPEPETQLCIEVPVYFERSKMLLFVPFRNIFMVLQDGIESVIKAFQEVKAMMVGTMQSTLIVYYSGHGLEHNGERYLQMGKSPRTSVSSQWMKHQLSDINPSNMLVIIDCCGSGAFDILPSQGNGNHTLWTSCSSHEVSRSYYRQGSTFTTFVVAGLKSGVQCFLKKAAGDVDQVTCSICRKLQVQCEGRTYLTIKAIEDYVFAHVSAKSYADGSVQTPSKRQTSENNTMIAYAHSEPLFYTVWFIEDDSVQQSIRLETIGQHLSQTREGLFKELKGKLIFGRSFRLCPQQEDEKVVLMNSNYFQLNDG